MGKQYQSREKRPSVDSAGKFSTSPSNFQPTAVQSLVEGRIAHSTPNEATVVPKVQPKLGRETGRRESREKLIISGKQISASLEEVQKEDSPTQINSTNQSPNNPVSDVAVQSNKVTSSPSIDEHDTAAGRKTAIEKNGVQLPQYKTKPVGNLRELFNSQEQLKTKFGHAFNSSKPFRAGQL
ncbi:uncharacterized protein LOC144742638 [Ciona intestinalis]